MRKLIHQIQSVATRDGVGVKINRVAGPRLNVQLDPFLLLDEIKSDDAADYLGGFPEHPHRGFETITYMKTGRMRHRDHMGNEGVIEAGDVQWMTAGRGVLHSEMPEQDSGLLHGFQLWLNLPATEKMKPAAYQDIPSQSISELSTKDGGVVRVIAGEVEISGHALSGRLPPLSTAPVLIDAMLKANELLEIQFNADHTALVYIYQGALDGLASQTMGVYSKGESLSLKAGASGAKLLVLGGKAIKEPIAQYGPFVMNNSEQIQQAVQDYQTGRLV